MLNEQQSTIIRIMFCFQLNCSSFRMTLICGAKKQRETGSHVMSEREEARKKQIFLGNYRKLGLICSQRLSGDDVREPVFFQIL